jgi:hypothetical protein
MVRFSFKAMTLVILTLTAVARTSGQSVPLGINYQAVARDVTGKEMIDKNIDVRFSIHSTAPEGPLVYQELHMAVTTSKYGVFTLKIGNGLPVGGSVGELSQIQWGAAPHYLNVEVRFQNDFMYMGTMQFLSVPYALYAAKSLEPGPAGPQGPAGLQGPPGDPASDKQTLSFNGTNLSISGNPGNTVNLTSLINDADSDPTNEIQNLSLKGDTLSLTKGGNFVTLKPLVQDLRLEGNLLRITQNNEATIIDLTPYLDNKDEQSLTWNPVTRVLGLSNSSFSIDLSRTLTFNTGTNMLSVSGGNSIDLTPLKNDADSDPANELISNIALQGSELVITEGGTAKRVDFASNMVAFRSKKLASTTASSLTDVTFTFQVLLSIIIGNSFNGTTGEFTAPTTGIYTFNVSYLCRWHWCGSRKVSIYITTPLYMKI